MNDVIHFDPKNISVCKEVYDIVKDNYNSPLIAATCMREVTAVNEMSQPRGLIGTWNTKIVSFGAYIEISPVHRVFRLCWINVHKDFRGQGYGRKMLLARILEIAKLNKRRGEKDFTVTLFCRESQRKFNESVDIQFWSKRSKDTIIMGQHLLVEDVLGALN